MTRPRPLTAREVLGVERARALADRFRRRVQRRPKHRHDYQRIGYGGAGWSLYRCACGATEIDA